VPGAFELEEILGEGGMGRVWRAVHRGSGLPVAVKSIRDPGSLDVRTFAAEVRAVATLDHPRVIRVFDQGVSGPDEDLPPGQPWLAMALGRGTLEDLVGAPWPLIQQALLHVLDGLAHVHARGIVHRDLKPRNVLLGCALDAIREPDHPIDGLVIADFGLASDRGGPSLLGGTPGFAAPEQRRPSGLTGPWSDVYAVGAMARLLAGSALDPIPPAIQTWCAWLTEEDPICRPTSAAEAMQGLDALPRVDRPARRPHTASAIGLESATSVVIEPFATVTWSRMPPPAASAGPTSSETPVVPPRPLPDDGWQIRRSPWPVQTVRDAGLGLLGLREPPFTGRREERKALWTRLGQVTRERRPHLLVLGGEPGVGRRRRARWRATRAHELGTHETLRGRPDDVVRQWQSHVRCRIGTEAPGLVDVIRDVATQRPAVVVIEDPTALDDLLSALNDAPGPWLAVLPWLTEEPLPAPHHPAVTVIRLDPLGFVDLERLVADALYLDHEAARTLAATSAGNPGIAMRRLRGWVRAGRLTPGPAGFLPPEDLRVASASPPTQAESTAEACLAASDVRGALEALVAASEEATRSGARELEHRIGRRIREIASQGSIPAEDRLYVRAMSVAVVDKMEGGRDQELSILRELLETAQRRGWVDLECRLSCDVAVRSYLRDPGAEAPLEQFERVRSLAERHGLRAIQAEASMRKATRLMLHGRLEEAVEELHDALAVAERIVGPLQHSMTAEIHGHLASLHAKLEDSDEFALHCEVALALVPRLVPRDASAVLLAIASGYMMLGDYERAQEVSRAVIQAARDAGFRNREATGWSMLGRNLSMAGRHAEAEAPLARSIALADRIQTSAMQARMALAMIRNLDGRHRDAWNLVDPDRVPGRRPHAASQQCLEVVRLVARYGRGADPDAIQRELADVVALSPTRLGDAERQLHRLRELAEERGANALARAIAATLEGPTRQE